MLTDTGLELTLVVPAAATPSPAAPSAGPTPVATTSPPPTWHSAVPHLPHTGFATTLALLLALALVLIGTLLVGSSKLRSSR